jgi:hypothetical protein
MDIGDLFEFGNDPPDFVLPGPTLDTTFGDDPPGFDLTEAFKSQIPTIDLNDLTSDLDEHNSSSISMRKVMEDLSSALGTPETDTFYWQPQTTGFTCAIQAQDGIIEMFTGVQISEAELVYEATSNGWLTDGGMSPLDLGKLLELHGVGCHSQLNATVEQLMAELASGHKVIIGVDSGELWGEDSPLEDFFKESADHAVWVTGIDISDPDHPQVIINDSGDPSGAGKSYDLQTFVDAWEDSKCHYVATNEAPSDLGNYVDSFSPEIAGFAELINWFGTNFDGIWGYLNSPDGRTDVAEATTTITGIAGLIFATDLLIDSVADLLNDADTSAVFQML